MIARPPQKKSSFPPTRFLPLLTKVANDNRHPKKTIFGWVVAGTGLLLLAFSFLWL